MKKLIISILIIVILLLIWAFYPRKADTPEPSGDNVSGGYVLPNPCDTMDCNLGKS